jgi:hypothetical protein
VVVLGGLGTSVFGGGGLGVVFGGETMLLEVPVGVGVASGGGGSDGAGSPDASPAAAALPLAPGAASPGAAGSTAAGSVAAAVTDGIAGEGSATKPCSVAPTSASDFLQPLAKPMLPMSRAESAARCDLILSELLITQFPPGCGVQFARWSGCTQPRLRVYPWLDA